MASWRDGTSARAQEELDALLDVALGFAQVQLATRGEFYPNAATNDDSGEAEMIAVLPDDNDHPMSADVVDACRAALAARRDEIRAGAIVADVHVAERDGDAIRVDLEHAEGPVLTVLLPYRKTRAGGGVDYGDIRAQAGNARIWA